MLEVVYYLVIIVMKLVLVICDIDILSCMVKDGLVKVVFLVMMFDWVLVWVMELWVVMLVKWFEVIWEFLEVGIFVGVMMVFIILGLMDYEIECVFDSVKMVGVCEVNYVLLCLFFEVSLFFCDWLLWNYLDCYCYVMLLFCFMCDGKDYDVEFGKCMKGVGFYVW